MRFVMTSRTLPRTYHQHCEPAEVEMAIRSVGRVHLGRCAKATAVVAAAVLLAAACSGGGSSGASSGGGGGASAAPKCGAGTGQKATGEPIKLGGIATKQPGTDFTDIPN